MKNKYHRFSGSDLGITGVFYSLIPLIFTIVSVAIPLLVFRILFKTPGKVF